MDLKIKKINDKIDFDVEANNGFCSGTCYVYGDGPGIPPTPVTGPPGVYYCTVVISSSANEGTWFWW